MKKINCVKCCHARRVRRPVEKPHWSSTNEMLDGTFSKSITSFNEREYERASVWLLGFWSSHLHTKTRHTPLFLAVTAPFPWFVVYCHYQAMISKASFSHWHFIYLFRAFNYSPLPFSSRAEASELLLVFAAPQQSLQTASMCARAPGGRWIKRLCFRLLCQTSRPNHHALLH